MLADAFLGNNYMIESKKYTKDGIRFVLSGIITSKELNTLNTELYNQWDIASFKYQLWIFTEVEEFLLSPDEMKMLANQDKRASIKNPNMKVALVSISPLIYGLCRMYEAFYGDGPWETMVFKSLDEAEKWIDS
jgi:hypothetical protein